VGEYIKIAGGSTSHCLALPNNLKICCRWAEGSPLRRPVLRHLERKSVAVFAFHTRQGGGVGLRKAELGSNQLQPPYVNAKRGRTITVESLVALLAFHIGSFIVKSARE